MSIINKIKELINKFKLNTELRVELEQKEKECEELHERTASIIHRLTGGRLTYSTYTLEGCEDAYADQLRIDVERATKELQEENGELKAENFAFENLVITQEKLIDNYTHELEEIKKYLGISDKTIMQRLEELQERRDKLSEENEELKNATVTLAEGLNFQQERADKLEQVLDEIKRDIISTCEGCRQTYYNQHCEECDKGYILNIINEVKANKNKVGSKVTIEIN